MTSFAQRLQQQSLASRERLIVEERQEVKEWVAASVARVEKPARLRVGVRNSLRIA